MTITFKAVEKPDPQVLARILNIEKQDFGNGALSEYVLVPLMRHGRIFIAVDEDDTAIASAYFLRDMYDQELVFLMSVAVLPQFKGYDIGIALLDYAFSDLKEIGMKKLQLTVDPANFNALSIYREKLGLAVVENGPDEYGAGDDRLVMSREL
jgi:[ribosomal protein S18]-alanine N-acetyltransferase